MFPSHDLPAKRSLSGAVNVPAAVPFVIRFQLPDLVFGGSPLPIDTIYLRLPSEEDVPATLFIIELFVFVVNPEGKIYVLGFVAGEAPVVSISTHCDVPTLQEKRLPLGVPASKSKAYSTITVACPENHDP